MVVVAGRTGGVTTAAVDFPATPVPRAIALVGSRLLPDEDDRVIPVVTR